MGEGDALPSGARRAPCASWLATHDRRVVSEILHHAIGIYRWIVLGAIIASWVAPGSRHPIVVFLEKATEPVLAPLRKVIPPVGGFDLTPIVLLIGLHFLQRLI